MKTLLCGSLMIVCATAGFARPGGNGFTVKVTNPAAFARQQETVVVGLNRASGRQAPMLSIFDKGTQIVCQPVDADGDGTPEQLVFQTSFGPKETKTFQVKFGAESRSTPSMVDARFVLPREDVAWENDRIAFRIYGPALAADVNSGIDVWCKRVRSLIVEKWYKANEGNTGGKDTYHEDHGEGADFFSVGRTLGAGGSALWSHDSVSQPGVFTTYKIIATGPIRAMFKVSYSDGTLDGKKYTETKVFTLDAGESFNKIDVTYPDFRNHKMIAVAAGVVKRKNTVPLILNEACAVGLWGQTNDDPVNESLGTGIVVPRENFVAMKEDKNHYLIIGKTTGRKPFTYFAGAGWTRSGDLSSKDGWERSLTGLAARIANPLKVAVIGEPRR
jgi:pectinesterase